MNDTLVFRPYQSSDHQALAAIIRETWHYDRFLSSKAVGRMARLYLDSCLANQTFTQVAVLNGNPVGIIMANSHHLQRRPLRVRLRWLRSLAAVLSTVEGRHTLRLFSDIQGIDKALLAQTGKTYDGEIAFFALSASARGKGLGRRLFASAINALRQSGVTSCYLFTDTSCNYGFYEHLGMTRRAQHTRRFTVNGEDATMTFFIYDCSC